MDEAMCMVWSLNGISHDPHDWWYTACGGGHQMWDGFDPEIHIEEAKLEKGLKKWHCPGS